MIQEKFSQNPELAEAKIQLESLRLELERYKSFCDLGERANLENEIMILRNQLNVYLESETSRSLKQRRSSLFNKDNPASAEPTQILSVDRAPESATTSYDAGNPESATGSKDSDLDRNDRGSDDEDLHLLVQELKEERDHYIQLAERRQKELDGEKRFVEYADDLSNKMPRTSIMRS